MKTPSRMPALFLGHGSPMNAIGSNTWVESWRRLGETLPRPRAILGISAHWYVRDTAVTAQANPPTLHDFYGFPPELFAIQYPAPGSAMLVDRIRELVKMTPVRPDHEWGLDHGTWSVLLHLYPRADIPVVQLSLDATRVPAWHYALGRSLSTLRDEGILVVASGNVVHNLKMMRRDGTNAPWEWAVQFESQVRSLIERRDHGPLGEYLGLGEAARLSVPTPEHYLPLLYVLGMQREDEPASFPTSGIDLGSISMLSVRVG